MHALSPDSIPPTELNLSEIPGKPIDLISSPQLIQPQSTNCRYEFRIRGGIVYRYDKETRLFDNPSTGKPVKNPVYRKTTTDTPSTLLYYQHPDVDRILAQHIQDPYMLQCIGYFLKVIVVKQQLKVYCNEFQKNRKLKKIKMPWLSHEFTKRILGESKYQDVVEKLVEIGIIDRRVRHTFHRKFNIYRLKNSDHLNGYTLHPITFKRLHDKILNYRQWVRKQVNPLDLKIIDQVINTGWEITITWHQLKLLWRARYEKKYLLSNPKKPLSLEEYMKKRGRVWQIIKNWNKANESEKLEMFTVDKFGNRIHYVYTYLPSEIRAYVRNRDGRDMNFTQFDLANSQPAQMANIMVIDHHYTPKNSDFVRLVCRQKIYEDLGRKMISDRDAEISEKMHQELAADNWKTKIKKVRPVVKTEMLHMLYSWLDSEAERKCQKYYPDVAEVARKIKKNEKDEDGKYVPFNRRAAQLPRMMQRVESKMFREVASVLLAHGYEFLPIHDAVYVAGLNPKQQEVTEDLIFSILGPSFKIPIKIKCEDVVRGNY